MLNRLILNDPEIFTSLDISTGHITQKDAALLKAYVDCEDETLEDAPLVVFETDYGFDIYCVGFIAENRVDALMEKGFSQNLMDIIALGERLGCKMVSFDCDGTIYAELEQFEW